MVILILFLLILLLIIRTFYLIYQIITNKSANTKFTRTEPAKTLICIGSGGHTTEILRIVEKLDLKKYSPRYYVMASTDTTSKIKIIDIEGKETSDTHKIMYIPRSRVVHQSYFTSIFTTLYSILYSFPILFKTRPDLILCNGPGTCVPICLISFLYKIFFISNTKIVFIESICRVKSLSLTGKILIFIADCFIVQWKSIKSKLRDFQCFGRL